MEIRHDAAEVLPGALQRSFGLLQEMWETVTSGARSAAEAEERVAELSREVGREVLSEGLSARYGKQEGRWRECECGGRQRFERYQRRLIVTVMGEVQYRRAYYHCASCGASHYTGEAALGLGEGRYSLPAQEAVSLLCAELPFERAAVLLERLCGVRVSLSHARCLSEGHGEAVRREAVQQCEQLFAGAVEYLAERREHRLYISLDATKTRFRDDWHETRVGAVYDAKPGRDGVDEPQDTTYVALAQQGLEQFGQALYQEAARRGVEHATEVVVVADGGPWIWNQAAEHFPQATQILDFYHAAERLHSVGRVVHGEGTRAAREWAERNVERLHDGNWKALLCSLKALKPRTKEGSEAVRLAIGYFTTNRQRMDYPSYRARGLHIGSGVVEAACKCLVATRCKRTGMRWTTPGAQAILALRCLLLNDRWDEYWEPLKKAA